MPASRAPALGEPSRGLSRRQPGDGSRWDGALAARRLGGGEASLIGSPLQRQRPDGILPATAAASCDSRPSRCGDFLLGRVSCENAGISRGRSSVPKAQCAMHFMHGPWAPMAGPLVKQCLHHQQSEYEMTLRYTDTAIPVLFRL